MSLSSIIPCAGRALAGSSFMLPPKKGRSRPGGETTGSGREKNLPIFFAMFRPSRVAPVPTFDLSDVVKVDYDFIPEATHLLQLERSEECAAAVREFLNQPEVNG